jgi:hypothetical protein
MVDVAAVHLHRDATAYVRLEVLRVLGDERWRSQAVCGNGTTGRGPMVVSYAIPMARASFGQRIP